MHVTLPSFQLLYEKEVGMNDCPLSFRNPADSEGAHKLPICHSSRIETRDGEEVRCNRTCDTHQKLYLYKSDALF